MKSWRRTSLIKLAGASAVAIPLAIAIAAYSQPAGVPQLSIPNPTGKEQVNVLGLGPQVETVTINQIRNSKGYLLVAAGTTVNTTLIDTNVQNVLATGAITTWNIVLSTAPEDGQEAVIGCPGGNTTTLSITATLPTGVAIVGTNPTSCTTATPTSSRFMYSASANTWYRVN